MQETSSLKGHFLIALPTLADPNFSRTVTYICEHTEQGSMGIVINQPSSLDLSDILQHMELLDDARQIPPITVYKGGPVQEDRGFLLHHPPDQWDSTLRISDDIAVTTSRDILQAIAENRGPEEVLIALGYAGWAPGQLERELQEDSWLFGPASRDILFHTPAQKRWAAAAQLAGVDLNLVSSAGGHA